MRRLWKTGKTWVVFLGLFLPATLAILAIAVMIYIPEKREIYRDMQREQAARVAAERENFSRELINKAKDLVLLSQAEGLLEALRSDGFETRRRKLADYLSMLGFKAFDGGLLLLNQGEMSFLWFDAAKAFASEAALVREATDLEQLASEVKGLERGALHVSFQHLPPRAVREICADPCPSCSAMRLATPVVDPAGHFIGALITYIRSPYDLDARVTMADNSKGRIVVVDSAGHCFGWMHPVGGQAGSGLGMTKATTQNAILEELKQLKKADSGCFIDRYGMITFVTLDPLQEIHRSGGTVISGLSVMENSDETAPHTWKIVSILSYGALTSGSRRFLVKLAILDIFLILISLVGSLSLAASIVRNRRAVDALNRSEQHYRTLAESAHDMIYILDRGGMVLYANASAASSLERRPGELTDQGLGDLLSGSSRAELDQAVRRVVEEGIPVTLVNEAQFPGKRRVWLNTKLVPIRNERGSIGSIMGISRDITDQKQSEEKILSSLREKDILLREIHHRVKNNLHAVSGLLSLQTYFTKDGDSASRFRTSQNRVISMAMVHEKLYQTQDADRIDFVEYVRSLTEHLQNSILLSPERVKVRVAGGEVKMNLDTAIPCGLIINELITNSFKYAFPNGKKGEVSIDVGRLDGGQFRLEVRDNGVGLPIEQAQRGSTTIGLRLVRDLVAQLGGKLEVHVQGGTSYRIIFGEYYECGTELHSVI